MKISPLARRYFPIAFYHSESKGAVMDRLQGSHFLEELISKVYLSRGHVGHDRDGGCSDDNRRVCGGTPVRPVGPYKLKEAT
jgi:hypothetical protein